MPEPTKIRLNGQSKEGSLTIAQFHDFLIGEVSWPNVSIFGGTLRADKNIIAVGDNDYPLTDNKTNYFEIDNAGVISSNTIGYQTGRIPLGSVTISSSAETSRTDDRVLIASFGDHDTNNDFELSYSPNSFVINVKGGNLHRIGDVFDNVDNVQVADATFTLTINKEYIVYINTAPNFPPYSIAVAIQTSLPTINNLPQGSIPLWSVSVESFGPTQVVNMRPYIQFLKVRPMQGVDFDGDGQLVVKADGTTIDFNGSGQLEAIPQPEAHPEIRNETPTGNIDSSNQEFFLANNIYGNTEQVYHNGLRQERGASPNQIVPFQSEDGSLAKVSDIANAGPNPAAFFQTFTFDKAGMFYKFAIYARTITSGAGHTIRVEIRDVVSGMPGPTVYDTSDYTGGEINNIGAVGESVLPYGQSWRTLDTPLAVTMGQQLCVVVTMIGSGVYTFWTSSTNGYTSGSYFQDDGSGSGYVDQGPVDVCFQAWLSGGIEGDYVIDTATPSKLTFITAPDTGDRILVDYRQA